MIYFPKVQREYHQSQSFISHCQVMARGCLVTRVLTPGGSFFLPWVQKSIDYVFSHTQKFKSSRRKTRDQDKIRQTDWLNNREKQDGRKDQGLWHTERWSIMEDTAGGSDKATQELQWSTGQNDSKGSVGFERKEHVSSRPPQSQDVSGPLSTAVRGGTLV